MRGEEEDLRRIQAKLHKEIAGNNKALADQKRRCLDIQMLKFGQQIDLSLLDTVGLCNNEAEELKSALHKQVRWVANKHTGDNVHVVNPLS